MEICPPEKIKTEFDYGNIIINPITDQQQLLLDQILTIYPQIDKKCVLKTIQYAESKEDSFTPLKKISKNAELPFAITIIEKGHYLIHFKRRNGKNEAVVKGSFKAFYGTVEISDEKVKKRGELLVSDAQKFETQFPHFRKEFDSPHVMRKPLYEIDHGKNKKSLIYPFYDLNVNAYLNKNKLSDHEKLKLFRSYVKGVADIHKQGFVHRDIKELNGLIKLDENGKLKKLKVSDLDSVIEEASCSTDYFGTLQYLPVTVMTKKEIQSRKTDMFMVARMACGCFDLPWIVDELSEQPKNTPLQDHMQPLISKLRSLDPNVRLTAEELLIELDKIENTLFLSA